MTAGRSSRIADLPAALERVDEIRARLGGRPPVLFLDYDGTLTPIVPDPRDALLPSETRGVLERLRHLCPVAVVSGRDLSEVRELVGVIGIHYAGSHGFDVLVAGGERHQRGLEFAPTLARCARRLDGLLDGIPGVWVERKSFALAVHYRRLSDPSHASRVEEAVDRVVAQEGGVRKTGGKKVFELRPDADWDKGRTVAWMLDDLEVGPGVPVYIGDDLTDEDAFRVLRGRGVGIVVRGEDDHRETAADYALPDPVGVGLFLESLADGLEESVGG